MQERRSWLSPSGAVVASAALPLALLLGLLSLGIPSSNATEAQLASTVAPGTSMVAVTDTDGSRHAGELASLQVWLRDVDGNLVLLAADTASTNDIVSRVSTWSDLELCQGVRHAVGLSSTSIALMRASYSAGSFSNTR